MPTIAGFESLLRIPGHDGCLPDKLSEFMVDAESHYLFTKYAELNDSGDYTFAQIADVIEQDLLKSP